MIKDIRLSSMPDRISTTIDYINSQKKINEKFTVIDVGGSYDGWSYPYVDAIVDLNAPTDGGKIKHFSFNINYPNGWKEIEEYVNEKGKFDFCICSHTLEDISNPKYVCDQLTKISKSGYIAVPSKYAELNNYDTTPEYYWLKGFIHHRWIFSFKNGEFIGFPKLSFIEIDPILCKLGKNDPYCQNLGFFWEDEIELHIVNDDFLGPNAWSVVWMYREQLFNDDIDKLLK
jgi:hypothetical protein